MIGAAVIVQAALSALRLTSWQPAALPPLPRPGTQPLDHLRNALAMWRACWDDCVREPEWPGVAGYPDAERRVRFVAETVASPEVLDDIDVLMNQAKALLLTRKATPDRFTAVEMAGAVRAVHARYAQLCTRLALPASTRYGPWPRASAG